MTAPDIHDPATCPCARCNPASRAAMRISQRGKAAAERAVTAAAEAWFDSFNTCHDLLAAGRSDDAAREEAVMAKTLEALYLGVERLREWREADRAGKARRRT